MGPVSRPPVILFADEDTIWSRWVRMELRRRGAHVLASSSLGETAQLVSREAPDVVLLDDAWGAAVPLLSRRRPQADVLLLVSPAAGDPERMRSWFHVGTRLLKPVDPDDLLRLLVERFRGRIGEPPRSPSRGVLCVDDDEWFLKAVERLLARHGHRVALCRSGREALVEARRSPPSVALVDVTMPGMDGYELAARLRALATEQECAIVMISGRPRDEVEARGREAGVTLCLTKPCLPRTVLNVVDYLASDLEPQERDLLR